MSHTWLPYLLVVYISLSAAQVYDSKYVSKDVALDISHGLNTLARDLSVQLQSNSSKSEIISPVSVGSSLLLLLRASTGTTRKELLELLHLTQYRENNQKVPRNFARLIVDLLSEGVEPPVLDSEVPWTKLSKCQENEYEDEEEGDYSYEASTDEAPSVPNDIRLANAMFVQNKTFNNPRLQSVVQKLYLSTLSTVDFLHDPEGAKLKINQWTNASTNGRIPEIISDQLSSETTMVVVNALYFKAFWEDVFLAGATKPREFFPDGESGKPIMVDVMAHGGCFPYHNSKILDARIMGFPYKNRTTTMYVILPNKSNRAKLQELMKKLDATTLDSLISNMTMSTATVLFPKMHLTSSFSLKSAIQSMGARAMFNREESNFSLLNPTASPADRKAMGLSVDGIIHKVDLAIDESGTEGAAITATLLDRAMPAVNFRVLTPFLIAIRHDPTKLLLFYGPVYDPSG